MTSKTIRIRASYIIGFDGSNHRYIKDGEIIYKGGDILYVGKKYDGEVDKDIDALGKVVSPGFICTHAHLAQSPVDRSFLEDCGNPQFYFSGLYEHLPAIGMGLTKEMHRVCLEYSLAEILRTGITTVVDIGPYDEDLIHLIGAYGNRVYFGPTYRSGRWYTPDGKQVLYKWFEDSGMKRMRQAVELIEKYNGACNGLLTGILCPSQVDTCSEELLLKSQEYAQRLDVPLTLHASQSVVEFNEMLRRHGKSPIAWLRDLGFLQKNVIIGHAIILGGSSWTNYPPGDLASMVKSGCSIAHSPWVFARRGITLESFSQYQEAGIKMSLGTDTCPQNMLHAMRWATVLSKVYERDTGATTGADVYNAATLGGADALGREDLGRLCPGAKADIVIFSGDTTNMVPLRDPVRNIVYNAETEDIETVIINGRIVLENGSVIGRNHNELNHELQKTANKLWQRIDSYDWAHRSVDELSPPTFDFWDAAVR